ncbi:tetratricopeptide repeat protein [Nonomuraea sp. SMC257]|uniref:Tetratricopeptide repeat protein n=1 Tax=Nonomuraea montanisoli TaxID=2741721 RepID=A0A7Y6I9I8_9ACTN|nr:BTAD domain-containing putative transcriptional regulator [Nonomuraea montanisoli]NUW33951.1 tetratricopeptide repeat protein [Nonomuraea montanisoli]
MEINLLGQLEVRDGRRALPVRKPRHRAVLATLALAAGRPVTVDRLLEALAGQREIGSTVIRVYLSELRGILPKDLIENVPGGRGYRLRLDPGQVDAHRFRRLLDRRDGDAAGRERALEEALALWRGGALEDVESDHLRRMEAEPLEELRAAAVEELCGLWVARGDYRRARADLTGLVAAHPLRESAYRLLLVALYRSGNLGEALALYEQVRRVLDEELGSEPSEETRLLHQRILRQDPSLSAGPRGPAPAELPRDEPDFTGRRELLDRVGAALAARSGRAPLPIILYGHAGAGKSTLAVHAAWRHRRLFPDGQLFADLRGEPDPGLVLARFLRSLNFPGGSVPASAQERLAAYRTLTATRSLLVLLDNAAGEEQVRPLLPTGPGSAAVITSRSPLTGISGGRPYEVDLFTPDEARTLLTRLGGAARVEADPTATGRVLDACAGLPLAVRVVGARLAAGRDTSTAALSRRLREEPSRLDELRAGDLAVRTPLELAYESLDDDLRPALDLVAALSAADFAAWGALASPGQVAEIAELGLLQRLAADAAGQDRFRLHDLVRLLVRERSIDAGGQALPKLGSLALTRVQAAVLPLAAEEFGAGTGPAPGTTEIRDGVEWLDAERGFLVALVGDLTPARPDLAWRLAHALTPFFDARLLLDEWETANRHAREAADAAGDERARGLTARDLGDLRRARRDLGAAVRAYDESMGHLVRHGGPRERAWLLHRLGLVHLDLGEHPRAERMLARGRAEFREAGDRRGAARCLHALGVLRHREGEHGVARDCLMSALAVLRDLGDRHAQAACLDDLVTVRLALRERAAARRAAEEEHDLAARRLRDPRLTAYGLLSLALVGHAEGAPAAGEQAGEAAARLRSLGDRHGHARALAAVGEITRRRPELELARSMFAELGDAHGRAGAEHLLNRL